MPKQVDHEARRQQIAEALWRITSRRGLDAVSLRDVAAEAGVSMGLVQHYFKTKDQMLLFALEFMNGRISTLVQARIAASSGQPTPRSILRATMLETLPLTQNSQAGHRVWGAYLARAMVEPTLAAVFLASQPEVHALISGQLRLAMADGTAAAGIDPDQEADILLALMQGLGTNVVLGYRSPDQALATVDYHLDRLLPTA